MLVFSFIVFLLEQFYENSKVEKLRLGNITEKRISYREDQFDLFIRSISLKLGKRFSSIKRNREKADPGISMDSPGSH